MCSGRSSVGRRMTSAMPRRAEGAIIEAAARRRLYSGVPAQYVRDVVDEVQQASTTRLSTPRAVCPDHPDHPLVVPDGWRRCELRRAACAVLASDLLETHTRMDYTGKVPVTVVPAPGTDVTSSVPPKAPSRSAMLTKPWPTAPLPATSKPAPSSTIENVSAPSPSATVTRTVAPSPACLPAFCIASSTQK